jgi:hypothetical protein
LYVVGIVNLKPRVETKIVDRVVEKIVEVEKVVTVVKIKKVYIKVPVESEVSVCGFPDPVVVHDTKYVKETVYPDLHASVSAMLGVGRVDTGKVGGAYGVHIQGYFNPIMTLGVYGLTNMTTGFSLGVTF